MTVDLGDRIADDLHRQGWSIQAEAMPEQQARSLAEESRRSWDAGEFRQAGIGRAESSQVNAEIRGDHVFWLEEATATEWQRSYLDSLEAMRLAVNRRLFLGLFDFEGHFAVYPPGAYYRAHLDRHRDKSDRLVTLILYLNQDWRPEHGGQLRLYTEPEIGVKGPYLDVEPNLGTLVAFLSEDFWHEVLPAHRERWSITGWFRARST